MTWSAVARTDGFPLLRHNVFFSRNYAAEFDDIFARDRLPRRTDGLCLRAGSRRRAAPQIDGEERLLVLVNALPMVTGIPTMQRRWNNARQRTFGVLKRCGLQIQRQPEATQVTTPADFNRIVSGDGRRAVRPQLARMDGLVPAAGSANQNSGPVSGGGQHASGSGGADGGAVGPVGGSEPARGPDFAKIVPPNGYAWWYVDALSDDGQYGITVIAFIGSVFSPYYAFARRKGPADPLNHCAINVAVYRKGGNRWAMTERPRGAVSRTPNSFAVGPSHLAWDGNRLTIRIDEISVPDPPAHPRHGPRRSHRRSRSRHSR